MLSVNIIAYPVGYVNTLIEICIELPKSKAVRLSLKMLHQKKPHPNRVRFFQLNPLMRNKSTYVDEIAKAMRSRLREVKLADLISSEAAG